jgi:photosystem II stability/assembly factor-like uncharacterized protein
MLNNDDLLEEEREYVPLVRQLRSIYDTHLKDEEDLALIRQQLSQTNVLPFETKIVNRNAQKIADIRYQDVGSKMPHRPFNKHFLDVLVATLVVMLLTGSFIALFTLIPHQRMTRTAGNMPAKNSSISKARQTFGPDKVGINSLRMFDEKRGWAQAYINDSSEKPLLLHTTDGGNHWLSVTPDNIEHYPLVYFLDANTAMVSSRLLTRTAKDRNNTYAEMYITRDSGQTWQKSNSQITGKPHSIFFLNANDGWILSMKEPMGASFNKPIPMMLFHTIDGGRTWQQMPDIKLATTYADSKVMFIDKTTGWLTKGKRLFKGNTMTIQMEPYVTHDGGASWQPVQIPGVHITGLPEFYSPKDAVFMVLQDSSSDWTTIPYVTHDGGSTWVKTNWPLGDAHSFLSPERWRWIDGSSNASVVLHITNDAGQHWTTLQPKGFKDPKGMLQLEFISEKVAWATVLTGLIFFAGKEAAPLYKTMDGGATWTHVTYVVVV